MSSRGHSTCLKCKQEYFNCSNPQIAQAAPCIWAALSSKRRRNQSKVILRLWKLFNPFTLAAVLTKVTIALLPVVGTHGCVALIEKCKVARSVHVNSGLVDSFECQHIKEAKNSSDCSPIATLYPDLVNYPCSDVVCSELSQIVSSLSSANSPSVIQVPDRSFAVFGSPSASNPLGLCHVQKEARTKSGYTCTGKDCRSYASKAKGIAVKACCLHLHLPFASLRQFPSLDSCTSSESISVLVIAGPSQTPSHTS